MQSYSHDDRLRPLGRTGATVSAVALGCWPIAGVTSLGVNDEDSIATIRAALDGGINHLDTAYCYGPNGESDRLIARAIAGRRQEVFLASKGGIHYDQHGKQSNDARPETLLRQCREILSRLNVEQIDLFYLHAPDERVPLAVSASAIRQLVEQGAVRFAGASNCTLPQLQEFHAVCPLAAVQLPYNMLQRDIERETIPWCRREQISVTAYWPMMKGLLAGRMAADQPLDPQDNRRNYPMYQGEEWRSNQQFVAALKSIADAAGKTVAQLVVNWTFSQPGITSALCGAKRPWQIEETAAAMGWRLSVEQQQAIAAAIAQRGPAAARRLFQ